MSYPAPRRRLIPSVCVNIFCALGIFFILCFIAIGPSGSTPRAPQNASLQRARTIALCLFQYSVDNNGAYPEGLSSTEIFQKLLDGKYANDPGIFYMPYDGKTKPLPSERLKPENVSFDVTCGVDSSAPDTLPTVFMTGFRVSYLPNGMAIPLVKPFPRFGMEDKYDDSWFGWLVGWNPIRYSGSGGLAVAYKDYSASFKKLDDATDSVPGFISSDFDAHGKTYRQLTPDGPLP